jgi:hypothetical protein
MSDRRWLLVAALAVAAGGPSQAGPLASASLTIEIAGAILAFPGAGATGTATSDLSATLGGGSVFAGTESVTLTGSAATQSPVDRFRILIGSNAAAAFGGLTPAQLGGSADVDGVASLYATAKAVSPFPIVPLRLGRTTAWTLMGSGLSWSI